MTDASAHVHCLADADLAVRCMVLENWVLLMERGDERAISAAIARLLDSDPSVRSLALLALSQLVKDDDERVIAVVILHLGEDRSHVGRAALQALSALVEVGKTFNAKDAYENLQIDADAMNEKIKKRRSFYGSGACLEVLLKG